MQHAVGERIVRGLHERCEGKALLQDGQQAEGGERSGPAPTHTAASPCAPALPSTLFTMLHPALHEQMQSSGRIPVAGEMHLVELGGRSVTVRLLGGFARHLALAQANCCGCRERKRQKRSGRHERRRVQKQRLLLLWLLPILLVPNSYSS